MNAVYQNLFETQPEVTIKDCPGSDIGFITSLISFHQTSVETAYM